MKQEERNVLEGMIDKHSLHDVLSDLEVICLEKAEHLRSNWQDEKSAKVWEKAATLVERLTFTLIDL